MDEIVAALQKYGPLTGKELLQAVPMDEFSLWAACNRSGRILTRIVGRRYLRLDRQVEDYARLSPSIMREFYGYTVIGISEFSREIALKAERVYREIVAVSQRKMALARDVIAGLVESHREAAAIKRNACFMIAGDVVYDMAHAEPRPEPSTGELVRGSDLDIVVVTDGLPEPLVKSLDRAIHREKYNLLMNPAAKEEIDYVVKDMARVKEQLAGKDFKSLVAVKILDEAKYLYGSRVLFNEIKKALAHRGIPARMAALEKKAIKNREQAEVYLLSALDSLPREESMKLFYTAEEREEIF